MSIDIICFICIFSQKKFTKNETSKSIIHVYLYQLKSLFLSPVTTNTFAHIWHCLKGFQMLLERLNKQGLA